MKLLPRISNEISQCPKSIVETPVQATPKPEYPALKQTYLVKYNTHVGSVTNECGKYYASEFLERFFNVRLWFTISRNNPLIIKNIFNKACQY